MNTVSLNGMDSSPEKMLCLIAGFQYVLLCDSSILPQPEPESNFHPASLWESTEVPGENFYKYVRESMSFHYPVAHTEPLVI